MVRPDIEGNMTGHLFRASSPSVPHGRRRRQKRRRRQASPRWELDCREHLATSEYTVHELLPSGEKLPGSQPFRTGEVPQHLFYDPQDPVPTVGGASYYFIYPAKPPTDPSRWYVPYGPQDQRESTACLFCKTTLPLAARQDVLMFQTPPLERDVEVTGPLTIKLWISSSAVDTDFTAKLIDVYPPSEDYPEGYAMNLADGILQDALPERI